VEDARAPVALGPGGRAAPAVTRPPRVATLEHPNEIVDAGATVSVQLLGQRLEPADLVIIGSHCVGLDLIVGELLRKGVRTKTLYVGSMGGLAAARRGECDIAGIHLMDASTGAYNRHLLTDALTLERGYGRIQGIVYRPGDARFEGKDASAAIAAALDDPDCTMVNRNTGSGTRILVDKLLGDRRPPGYGVQTKSHNAVAAAVQQSRADWGVAISTVADPYGLSFLPLQAEQYDFVIPRARAGRAAVAAFRDVLNDPATRERLRAIGFDVSR
jgi:putative molybdopterin biosynthesis protein